ncbi:MULTISPECIES: oligosaccharide flippase family protein [unclassified Pseudomonas]|uniref:oligosaccharide flippase family protein n=1 Tax=unclassified Pseudomonas TaxID=196821 RepID=UPI000CD16485|nr:MULTISPECIES: oligosaccharide flippase family protein [unclassified Pseudomonas]POA33853.1 polysaccharide biosynthesis protein [Pseudomonas sp. GW456-R21]POA65917.1 polysaccharide biosynthesis protein [Pseudomonas sp. GW460-R15]
MPSIELSSPQSLRKRVIWAGALNIGCMLASHAMRLGGNLVITRLLVPEMFGVMAIVTTVSVLLLLLSDVGLRQNIIQSPRGDDPLFLNTMWTVQIVRGFVLFLLMQLLALCAWFAQHIQLWPAHTTYAAAELPLALALTGFFAVIYGFQSTKVDVAIRTFQQKKVVLAELITQLAGLVVMLVAGYFTRSIWSLVAASLLATLVYTVLSHLMFQGPNNRPQWDPAALREMLDYGRWILLSSAVGVLAMQGDRIWFGGSMSVMELGVYSIAVSILGTIQLSLQRLAGAVALPALSEAARSGDKERLRNLYYRFRLLFDLVSLFACGFLLTASPLIIGWLYDARYAGAGSIMAILSLSLFTLRFTLAHQIWLALGLTKYLAMDNIIRVISLFILLPLLLAIGGVTYAIWGVALHTYLTLFLIYKVSRQLGLFDLRRELAVLPALALGALFGALLVRLFA